MPSTYLSLHYHLVFGTKNRGPFIVPQWRSRLHEYMGGTIVGLGGIPQGIGGVADHVHLLVGLKATHCLADVLRELKKASSTWVHDQIGNSLFAWQEGYAAFTVGAAARQAVQSYITNQEAHRRTHSFREELVAMLERAGIKCDAKYLE
ncbi:MAG: IS200/IS605 family transposase [Planctomycetes bacterium]|nr:IS200/IS605 family transposase [Planctomycetota bacterium]